jgi:hypothetical protein
MLRVPMDQATGGVPEREPKMSDEAQDLNRKAEEEEDTEGHSLFGTFDYYSQRSREREAEIERESRQREQAREAREAKKNRR